MKVTGIIVEYNPFHNGHVHHLNQTKKITESDYIIAVMSGNFVQRGEPAFLDKWSRTEMALKAGVDLVIELPLIYSISSAEGFAFGAVSLLNSLGIVNNLCFGSESGNLDSLSIISEILANEPADYKNLLKDNLKAGLSFPSARQRSIMQYALNKNYTKINPDNLENIVNNSNNILAIEYIKSLIKLKSNIKPFTIDRISNKYNQKEITGCISSATAIRNNINNIKAIEDSMPNHVIKIIKKAMQEGSGPISINNFSQLILYKLRTLRPDQIRELIDVSEGLEYRIKQAADESSSICELVEKIKNKRYTTTRIQRILMYALLDITKDLNPKIKLSPEYIRILGFNSNGRILLKEIKKYSSLPLITNPSNRDLELLKYDIHATDIYSLAYMNVNTKKAKQDLVRSPIII